MRVAPRCGNRIADTVARTSEISGVHQLRAGSCCQIELGKKRIRGPRCRCATRRRSSRGAWRWNVQAALVSIQDGKIISIAHVQEVCSARDVDIIVLVHGNSAADCGSSGGIPSAEIGRIHQARGSQERGINLAYEGLACSLWRRLKRADGGWEIR